MLEILNDLKDADGHGITVAIVDSGVEGDHPWVGGRLVASYEVVQTSKRTHKVVKAKPNDGYGHGTAAAGQIRRFAPAADLISIRVLDESLRTTSQALLAALKWLADPGNNCPIHVVNLSLSTQREQYALRMEHAVDDLYTRDIACICARGYHLTGRAYPTYFASTIAVTYDHLKPARLKFRPRDLIELEGAGVEVEIAWRGGVTRVAEGSSYACPLVTGLAARLLSLKPDLTPYELMTLLKAYALRQESGWREDWMDAVARAPVDGKISPPPQAPGPAIS